MLDGPLTSVDPLGIGTAHCESLSGYVQRVAALHGSRPGHIVFRILAWIDQGRSVNAGRWASGRGRLLLGNNINGFTQADSWVRALQYATGRSDLVHLTTRGWDSNFPTRGFLAAHLTWCPLCLSTDLIPYHRILWMLAATRVCPTHQTPLQRRCARCRREIPVIHDRSLVTGCPHCGGDLRHLLTAPDPSIATEFDLWTVDELGRIIAQSAKWHRPLAWDSTRELNALAISQRVLGAAAFARTVGTSKVTAWYWLSGKARPSLTSSLHVFHRCGAWLSNHLGCIPAPGPCILPVAQPEFHLSNVRHLHQRNWAEIRRKLLAALKTPDLEACPLSHIAHGLDVPVRSIRAHFPELCLSLSHRHRTRRCRERAERDELLIRNIQAAIAALSRRQVALSKRNIEKLLRRPGLFNSHYARRIYDAARDKRQRP